MKDSIIAVTVTFNSSKFLCRVVESLKKQTHTVNKIIVVDNNSKLEEKEVLKKIDEENDNVEFIWLESNSGGAGGFYQGMKYAREIYDPDWYWIMDDDAFPNEDCLEKLLEHSKRTENIGCLAPLIYGVDNKEYQLYHHKKLSKYLDRDLQVVNSADELDKVTRIEADAFVGPLFSKKAVQKLGVADGDLFIYGDDLEYTYRVSREFDVFLIKDAVINHQDQVNPGKIINPKVWWKDYYMFRNRLLFVDQYQKGIISTNISRLIVFARIFKQILLAIFISGYKGLRIVRIKTLLKALSDGICNKKGKTVDPIKYISMINEKINN